jgi:hypothetical protein
MEEYEQLKTGIDTHLQRILGQLPSLKEVV